MSRNFLAGLRGPDGRSLARALVLLLVVAACLGAVHSGRMAADAAHGMVICSNSSAGTPTPGNQLPATKDHCICCEFDCAATGPAVLATAIVQLAAAPPETKIRPLSRISAAVPVRRLFKGSPRGPPVLV